MIMSNRFYMVELEYIGSYTVQNIAEDLTTANIKNQVQHLQKKRSVRDVLLFISVTGVKVTDKNDQTSYVSSSLFQINYCTYIRESRLFCFLSRESSRFEEVHQYCHIFTTQSEEVDELNENIRNALSSANTASTTIPQKTQQVLPEDSKNKPAVRPNKLLTRSHSSTDTVTSNRLLQRQQSLNFSSSYSFSSPVSSSPTTPSQERNVTPLLTESLDEGALRKLIRAKTQENTSYRLRNLNSSSPLSESLDEGSLRSRLRTPTLEQITEKPDIKKNSESKTMLKHTVSSQAKLEAEQTKHANPFEQSIRKVRRAHKTLSSPIRATEPSALNHSYPLAVTSRENNSTDLCNFKSAEDIRLETSVDTKWKQLSSPAADTRICDNSAKGSDGIYTTVTIPPPTAFSNQPTPSETPVPTIKRALTPQLKRDSYNDIFKDYIESDKGSLNNNLHDAMSFYSDDYMRTASLGSKRHASGGGSSTGHMDRTERLRQSNISSGSSGISVNSFESEIMHMRPLPQTPRDMKNKHVSTQSRYQNDSPFRLHSSDGAQQLRSRDKPANEHNTSVDDLLRHVVWFQPQMSREQVLEMLGKDDIGSFIIRESTTHAGCYALSVKVPKFNNPTGIAHYIIHRTDSNMYRIKGLEKEWPNLSALVTHHTIMPELLPCTLQMPQTLTPRRHGSTTSRSSSSSRASSSTSISIPERQVERINLDIGKIKLTVAEAV